MTFVINRMKFSLWNIDYKSITIKSLCRSGQHKEEAAWLSSVIEWERNECALPPKQTKGKQKEYHFGGGVSLWSIIWSIIMHFGYTYALSGETWLSVFQCGLLENPFSFNVVIKKGVHFCLLCINRTLPCGWQPILPTLGPSNEVFYTVQTAHLKWWSFVLFLKV